MVRAALRRLAPAGLALGSFACVSVHGAGLLLVPALAPLCGAGLGRRALALTEPLLLALAAAGLPPAVAIGVASVLAGGVAWAAWAGLASARPRGWQGAIRAACHGRRRHASRSAGQ